MANHSNLALHLTEAISTYMKARFYCKLQKSEDPIPFPPEWDSALLHECDQAVSILLEAHGKACEWPTLQKSVQGQSIFH
jgi:hypothetical protein